MAINAFTQNWDNLGGGLWMNPPFGIYDKVLNKLLQHKTPAVVIPPPLALKALVVQDNANGRRNCRDSQVTGCGGGEGLVNDLVRGVGGPWGCAWRGHVARR